MRTIRAAALAALLALPVGTSATASTPPCFGANGLPEDGAVHVCLDDTERGCAVYQTSSSTMHSQREVCL